jgi:hypothetical protein
MNWSYLQAKYLHVIDNENEMHFKTYLKYGIHTHDCDEYTTVKGI